MPVIPAPTMRTSTVTDDTVPIGPLRWRRGRAVRDATARPGPEGALLRPGLLRPRGRAALAPGLADGVPPGGDPEPGRLRRVRDRRPVGGRRPPARRLGQGVPERLPPSRRPGRPGAGEHAGRLHLPVPRL